MAYDYDYPTTKIVTRCTVRVIVQVMFDAQPDVDLKDSTLTRLIDCWLVNAAQIWNHERGDGAPPHTFSCRDVAFEFLGNLTRASGEGNEHWHQITLHKYLSGGATVTMPAPATPLVTDEREFQATGDWDINESYEVVAHEIGHILWLDDEYDDIQEHPIVNTTTPTGMYHNPAQMPQCVMMSTDAEVVVSNAHMHLIVHEKLGVPYSLRCCSILRPLRLIRALWQFIRRGPAIAPSPSTPDVSPPPPPPPPPAGDTIFAEIDSARGRRLARLGNWMGQESTFEVGFLVNQVLFATDSTPRQRWLAVIGLGRARGTADKLSSKVALEEALEDTDISVRMHAAHSLHLVDPMTTPSNEEAKPRFEVLIRDLGSDELMIRHPVIRARVFADRILRIMSGTAVGFMPHASLEIRKQGIQRWRRHFGLPSETHK